ncbi:MAG: alpha/beta fold hydrolase [Bacteroidales bacterium]
MTSQGKRIVVGVFGGVGLLLILLFVLAFLPLENPLPNHPVDADGAARLRDECEQAHLVFDSRDGESLFMRRWEPDSLRPGTRDVAVLIFHGVTAHSGAYAMAGEPLAAAGYTTFGFDYRGHGLSGGRRGDYASRQLWVSDLAHALDEVHAQGFEKVVLLGHSLGVAAAIYTAREVPDEVSALILLSGGYERREGTGGMTFTLLQKLQILSSAFLRPGRPVVTYYRENITGMDDPLFNFRYSYRALSMVQREYLDLPADLDIPVLVAVGEEDELFGPETITDLYNDVPGTHKELMFLPGATHASFPSESWASLIDWLDRTYGGI